MGAGLVAAGVSASICGCAVIAAVTWATFVLRYAVIAAVTWSIIFALPCAVIAAAILALSYAFVAAAVILTLSYAFVAASVVRCLLTSCARVRPSAAPALAL